jgi:hypothetical protein
MEATIETVIGIINETTIKTTIPCVPVRILFVGIVEADFILVTVRITICPLTAPFFSSDIFVSFPGPAVLVVDWGDLAVRRRLPD